MKAVALGVNSNVDRDPVHRRRLICILTGVITTRRELLATGISELEGFAVGASKSVGQWVEAKIARKSKGRDNVRRSHEGVRCRIRVIAAREVAIVRSNNCKASERVAFWTKRTYSN